MRLTQILWNLLNNAIKYTGRGGHIWVTAAKEQNNVVICVRDTGIGMPADFIPHAFDLFNQADSATPYAHGGLGIGLSLVRSLVELHGGSVAATSLGQDKGSEFAVSLPMVAANA